jgi:hypothetical protein
MNAERIQIPDLTHVTFAKGCLAMRSEVSP